MHSGKRLATALVLTLVLTTPALPADAPSVDTLAFLSGHWTRTTDGMLVEQVFLPPAGGTVVGMQRRTREGETLVSYFFVIQETADGIVCRFKHFENDYTTYEDRNETGPRTFTLLEGSRASALFEERTAEGSLYLRYRLTEAGQLAIAVGSRDELRSGTAPESLHDRVTP